MYRWIAKRHVAAHPVGGGAKDTMTIPQGSTVSRETDSPMQDLIYFTIDATGQQCWMDSDYFMHNFTRV